LVSVVNEAPHTSDLTTSRLDCTDMIDYNCALLNRNDLEHSFFCMDKDDPTIGFDYDARTVFGPTYPADAPRQDTLNEADRLLHVRLLLGSHMARYLRHELESQKGYTATVGIATNKTLSKLVGNVNKPKNQTTLVPPLADIDGKESTVHQFMDMHDVGKVPGIGFKLAQKIRVHVLGREATHEEGLVYGNTRESVTVRDVRLHERVGPDELEEILGGPGSQKGIGGRVWDLLNGIDHTEVSKAKRVPSQISQENSYMKYLHTFEQVRQQLFLLAERLIRRMHLDLMEDDEEVTVDNVAIRRWLAHPRTLRLTTRPRPPLNTDGTRVRSFNRISHSGPMPNYVFSLTETPSVLADRLVDTTLVPMFRKLHTERNGWNLSLINIAATNMAETAADSKDSEGRDIGRMFRRQEDVLKDFKVVESEDNAPPADIETSETHSDQAEPLLSVQDAYDSNDDGDWLDEDQAEAGQVYHCYICGLSMPSFAIAAHIRYHDITSEGQLSPLQ